MKMHWLAMMLLPALGAAWFAVPQGHEQGKRGLVRVNPAGRDEDGEVAGFDREASKRDLTASDLEARERAFDRLAKIARRDPAAREALEEWSKGTDADLAWTSRLLLRESQRGPRAFGLSGMPGQDTWGRSNAFDLDDFAERFEDLDSMFGDLRAQWDEMFQAAPDPFSGSSSAESMSLEMGPDGVTCKITEKVDGKEETKSYQAKSMDELLEAHPELRGRLGGGSGFRFHTLGQGGLMQNGPRRGLTLRNPRTFLFEGDELTEVGAGEPRTDRLGIVCTQVEGGLQVDDVQDGSIASLLGLRGGDLVVEVNGQPVREPGDVKKILEERSAEADVSVGVRGDDGQRRTLTWRPPESAQKKAAR